jgi:integrase
MAKRANNEGTICKRADGRWMAAAMINGKREYFYGKTQGEVKGKLDEALEQSRKGIFVKTTKITFEEWLYFWLNEIVKSQVRPTSYNFYEYIIRVHIIPQLGNIPLSKITTELLDQFYNQKRQEKRLKIKADILLSRKTVSDIRKVIGMALKKAVAKKKIPFDPNQYTESIGKENPEVEYLTLEEIADFLEKISDDYWYPAYVTALGTGLRVGELAALQWKHIDIASGFLKVEQSAVKVNNYKSGGQKQSVTIQQPKTKKSIRKVPLPLDVIRVLRTLQAKQREFKGNVIDISGEEFVFSWPDGKMVTPSYLSKHFKRLATKHKLNKNIHFHCLRHSYASMLLANGEEMKIVQENLGHSDIRITSNIYTHVIDEMKTRSAERLNGFTMKKKATK